MGSDFEFSDLTEFLPKTITQIYGGPASGKTNLCLFATVSEAVKDKKVLFIDTEGSFSVQRIKQIAGAETNKVLSNVILAEPKDFDEQKIAVNKLESVMAKNDIGLVVVDSLVSLYRLEMGVSDDPYSLNRQMSKMLAKLLEVAKEHEIPVIATNQVYASFDRDGGPSVITPVGRDLVRYWTKVIIALEKEGTTRIAMLERHKFKPEGSELRFRINDSGLVEVKNESIVDNRSPELQG